MKSNVKAHVIFTPCLLQIQEYYVPQMLCEINACNCDELISTCWSELQGQLQYFE